MQNHMMEGTTAALKNYSKSGLVVAGRHHGIAQ